MMRWRAAIGPRFSRIAGGRQFPLRSTGGGQAELLRCGKVAAERNAAASQTISRAARPGLRSACCGSSPPASPIYAMTAPSPRAGDAAGLKPMRRKRRRIGAGLFAAAFQDQVDGLRRECTAVGIAPSINAPEHRPAFDLRLHQSVPRRPQAGRSGARVRCRRLLGATKADRRAWLPACAAAEDAK